MSVVNQFKIERLNSSGVSQKGIKFLTATSAGDSITLKNVKFSSAGAASSSNYAANWGGVDRLISVTATLHNDGTDKSTDSSGIITLKQQWDYLMDVGGVIQGISAGETQSDNRYRVTLYIAGSTKTITGMIEDFNVNADPTSPMVLTCTFNLFEGN